MATLVCIDSCGQGLAAAKRTHLGAHDGLAFACEKRGIYPKKAMTIMKVWAVLFAFVGIQMAWNLQPFVGDRGRPFQLFRHNEGNFYTAVVYSLEKLAHGEEKVAPVDPSVNRRLGIPFDLRTPSWPDTSGARPR